MEPIWLHHYPEGVPQRIECDRYASLVDVLERSMVAHRDNVAFESLGGRLHYGDVDRLSQHFASYLQNILGLAKGDRLALMMPNLLTYPVAIIGALRAGMVVVNINPQSAQREIAEQLRDSGSRAILVAEPYAHKLAQVLPETAVERTIVSTVGDLQPTARRLALNARARHLRRAIPSWKIPGHLAFADALARGERQPANRCVLTQRDLAFLQYTGGTTGEPRGVMLSHGNMVANVLQCRAWIMPWIEEGRERIITALPIHHAFALTANFLVFFAIGGTNLLIANPRDFTGLVRAMARTSFTAFTGVNTLFNRLLNTPGFGEIDFSALKVTLGGGSAVQAAVAERWRAVTGKPLTEAYGLTEAAPAVSMNPLSDPEYNGTVGMPLPATEISVRDESGAEVPTGTAGELCVRGPQVTPGYWRQEAATRAAFTRDGFLRTGDIARLDERGCITLLERRQDVIIVSGFNVYPSEVEAVVAGCDGVLECACMGVPDSDTGEAVKLFVVRTDESLDEPRLRAYCAERLSRYKLPRDIVFVEEMPKSHVGKILRRALPAR